MKVSIKLNGFEVTAWADIEERTNDYPGSVSFEDHEVWVEDNKGQLHRASEALEESILSMWEDDIEEALSEEVSEGNDLREE
jgi:hypothetical protein